MRVDRVGRTHCCIIHGCKYSEQDCPVVNAEVLQDYLCEDCDGENFFLLNDEDEIDMKKIKHIYIKKSRNKKIKKLNIQ